MSESRVHLDRLLHLTRNLRTDNQFLAYRSTVKSKVRAGSNELLLHFESAFLKGRKFEKSHAKNLLWNGDSSRLHVRKAQYKYVYDSFMQAFRTFSYTALVSYGWDWGAPVSSCWAVCLGADNYLGPVLMTVGPWKPVRLETYKSRVSDIDIRTQVSEALDVKLSASITISDSSSAFLSFSLMNPDGLIQKAVKHVAISSGRANISWEWPVGQLRLWHPVKYGSQPLYTAEIELVDAVSVLIMFGVVMLI